MRDDSVYPMIGDGFPSISLIHVGDAARATVAALTCKPDVYNVDAESSSIDPSTGVRWAAQTPDRVPVMSQDIGMARTYVS